MDDRFSEGSNCTGFVLLGGRVGTWRVSERVGSSTTKVGRRTVPGILRAAGTEEGKRV